MTALSVDSVIVNVSSSSRLMLLRLVKLVHTMAKPALKVIMCLVCAGVGFL